MGCLLERVQESKYLFMMLIPGIVWYIIFHYGPLYGILLAFKDFSPRLGILGSPWVGLDHFKFLFFQSPDFMRIFRNTMLISCYHVIFGFPAPIILALLLNEVRLGWFKRIAQTISYIPHFFSWVVLSGIVIVMLSPSEGPINFLLKLMNMEPIYFLADTNYFRSTLVATGISKEIGWERSFIWPHCQASIPPSMRRPLSTAPAGGSKYGILRCLR